MPRRNKKSRSKSNTKISTDGLAKIKPAISIYKRLLHDKSLNINLQNVSMVYEDKILGKNKEICILDWKMKDNDNISIHNVLYFVLYANNNNNNDDDKLIIWHKEEQLDRLFCSGITNKNQLLKTILNLDKYKKFESIKAKSATSKPDTDRYNYYSKYQNSLNALSLINELLLEFEPRQPVIDVIYDMETGDPDDLFAVLFLISNPRVNVRAITITPGTLLQVGAIHNVLYKKLKLPSKSILIGSAKPNHKKQCLNAGVWRRVCGNGTGSGNQITPMQPDGLGCDIIHQTLCKYKDCLIVTGAPLTNLYKYVIKYGNSDIIRNGKKIKWVCQGGFAGDNIVPKNYRLSKFDGREYVGTWNFNGNIEAAQYLLLNNNCNNIFDERYLVSKNVCHGVCYNQNFQRKMYQYKDKHPALKIIYDEMDMYLRKKPQGKKFHDVLAAVVAINRNVCEFREIMPCMRKHHRAGHEWGSKMSPNSNVFISVSYNPQRFFETFVGI